MKVRKIASAALLASMLPAADGAHGSLSKDSRSTVHANLGTYSYVGASPLRYYDPNGLDRWGDDPAFRWRPAEPARTELYICEGLSKGNYIERDRPGYSSDLSWRDAEHYLFAYNTVLETRGLALPTIAYASGLYSPGKMLSQKLNSLPRNTSPGSIGEAQMGFDGAFDAMDFLTRYNVLFRWANRCACP